MLHELSGHVGGRPAVPEASAAQPKPAVARSFPGSSGCALRACPALAKATTLGPGCGHAGVGLGQKQGQGGHTAFHLSQGPAV